MSDISRAVITGRLTRDVELKYSGSGFPIASISIASGYRKKSGEDWVDEVSFLDCTILGKRAESLAPYLTKGTRLSVDCKIRQERWEKDGQKRSKVAFVVDDLVLLGGKNENSEQQNVPVPANNIPDPGKLYDDNGSEILF